MVMMMETAVGIKKNGIEHYPRISLRCIRATISGFSSSSSSYPVADKLFDCFLPDSHNLKAPDKAKESHF
jgi:hypothetical protein